MLAAFSADLSQRSLRPGGTMIDPKKRPISMQVLVALIQSGELRLWPAELENVVNAIPTGPILRVNTYIAVEGIGMRTIQSLELLGYIAIHYVPVIEITAEGRLFMSNAPGAVAVDLERELAEAPVGRYRTVECGKCHNRVRIPSDIPGDWFACAECVSAMPK